MAIPKSADVSAPLKPATSIELDSAWQAMLEEDRGVNKGQDFEINGLFVKIKEAILALPGISESLRKVLESENKKELNHNILSEVRHIRSRYPAIEDLFEQLKNLLSERERRESMSGRDQI